MNDASFMSDSLQPHGLQPTGLLCPWGFSRQEYWSRLSFPTPVIQDTGRASQCSSADKESACSAGDPSSIPGSARYTREGIGYPFQYSRASLVAQMVKNPPAVRETWVQSLDWEDPLEEDMATHSSVLSWRIPMDRRPDGLQSKGPHSVGHD